MLSWPMLAIFLFNVGVTVSLNYGHLTDEHSLSSSLEIVFILFWPISGEPDFSDILVSRRENTKETRESDGRPPINFSYAL